MQGYFPAALAAFEDLDACDTLALLGKAANPDAAARLTLGQISAALRRARRRARRRDVASKAAAIQAALRSQQLGQPAQVTAAYASSVRALVALLGTLNEQVDALHIHSREARLFRARSAGGGRRSGRADR